MTALLALLNTIRGKLWAVVAALAAALWVALQAAQVRQERAEERAEELARKVRNQTVKEEANAHRSKPVVRDKRSILDRM